MDVGSVWVLDEPGVTGYWKPKYCYNSATDTVCEFPAVASGQYPLVDTNPDGGPMPSNLDVLDVYSTFSGIVPGGSEITRVMFVLGMQPFALDTEVDVVRSSHGAYSTTSLELKSRFENGCIMIENIDDIPYWIDANSWGSLDWTCMDVNILRRDDCSAMADVNAEFCEGVEDVGANEGILSADIGAAGLGGCREILDRGDPESIAEYGRDWFVPPIGTPSLSQMLSDQMTGTVDENIIGRCCGNDPDDEGVLFSSLRADGSVINPNQYLCMNATYLDSPAFIWADAGVASAAFKIREVQKEDNSFDAISNSENWFMCRAPGSPAQDLYDRARFSGGDWVKTSGPLLYEYEILPAPEERLISSTTPLGPEEGAGLDEGTRTDTGVPSENPGYDDSVSEDVFMSDIGDVTGPGQVSDCDKDGDGYDGAWTVSEVGEGGFIPDPERLCSDPQPPFDCDDWTEDDEEQYGIANVARIKHPGAINFCGPGNENMHLDCGGSACIPEPDINPDDTFASPDPTELYHRFICHNEDDKGSFAECCGWDLSFCFNEEQGRREGSMIHTLREFSFYKFTPSGEEGDTATADRKAVNYVLRYGVDLPPLKGTGDDPYGDVDADDTYNLALFSPLNDLQIKEWSHYKNLEFYIWMTTNFEVDLWLGDFVPDPALYEGSEELLWEDMNKLSNYDFPFKVKITDYVVNEPELGKWMHVIIPIDDIFKGGAFEIDSVVFASNTRKLMDLGTTVHVDINGNGYAEPNEIFSNVIGVDKLFLKPESDLPAGADNLYCSGTWPPTWFGDLDDTSIRPAGATDMIGRSACEAIPAYGWTGTLCCGDDTGSDSYYNSPSDKRIGPMVEVKEFYNDEDSGCWSGNRIVDDERAMLVEYDVFGERIQRSCRNNTCLFGLPQRAGVLVENPNPEVYALAFVDGGYRSVGLGGLTPNSFSYLKAEDVPLLLQYKDHEFWSCNADQADYIYDLDNEITPEPNDLVTEDDEHRLGSCDVKGIYFCDHVDGPNLGWSAEALLAYPHMPEGAAEATFTIHPSYDGEIELSRGTVPAMYRKNNKTGYNLVYNGGFEEI
ncbi:hypothetical protein KY359_04845 [Candidatus Woesearchaeota archaeon]|nr:hypothetical protein [Candidatus Woesearchaeota archaeon]